MNTDCPAMNTCDAVSRARRLGASVRYHKGEVVVAFPDGERVRANARRKEACFALKLAVWKRKREGDR